MPDSAASPHPFDLAARVAQRPEGGWRAATSADYWAFRGPFGGMSAATILNALRQEAEGEPVALTVDYAGPVAEGDFVVATRLRRANRSTSFWNAEILQQDDAPLVTASAVFATRRESWSHQPATMPAVSSFESTPVYDQSASAGWTGRYEFRFAVGAPTIGHSDAPVPGETTSMLWLRDRPARPLDLLSVAAYADCFFGRIFHAVHAIVPFGTVSMSVYFQATEAEIRDLGAAPVLAVARTRRFHAGYHDQQGELWSSGGRLLATTHQLAYFRH